MWLNYSARRSLRHPRQSNSNQLVPITQQIIKLINGAFRCLSKSYFEVWIRLTVLAQCFDLDVLRDKFSVGVNSPIRKNKIRGLNIKTWLRNFCNRGKRIVQTIFRLVCFWWRVKEIQINSTVNENGG